MTGPQPTPSGLPETRCGLANTPGHEPHDMRVTGEWPPAGPHRRCVGYSEQPTPSAEVALADWKLAEAAMHAGIAGTLLALERAGMLGGAS